MKAIVFKKEMLLSLEDRPYPDLVNPDDVVVRVHSTGICGTDRNILLGRFPARQGVVLGHESVGYVTAIGSQVPDFKVGDRVVVNPTLYCGHCHFCRRGAFNFCDNKTGAEIGVDRDGTFADYVRMPARFLHHLPPSMALDRAVFIEPLACVMNNANAVDLQPADDVVILGGGPIGMVFALYAQRFARKVIVVENDPFRRSFAAKLDLLTADSGHPDWQQHVVDQNDARQPSVVIETSGVLLDAAVALVAKGGRIAVMGFNGHVTAGFKVLRIVNNGIRVVGAGDYNGPIFPAAIELAAELPLEKLITHRFTLAEHDQAFNLLTGNHDAAHPDQYGAMKILICSE